MICARGLECPIGHSLVYSVVGQNNGHCTLFQNFTKNFNSLLTWPMIFSQVMPKINRNIRNKGSAAFDEYVGKLIDQKALCNNI